MTEVAICAQVTSDNPHHIARAIEALARAAAGLALEGISVTIYAETLTEIEEEVE